MKFFPNLKSLTFWVRACFVFWIIAQVVVLLTWDLPQISDFAAYKSMAERCVAESEFYPMKCDLYSSYIWAPGYINWLILNIILFGGVGLVTTFNVAMNIGIALEIRWLGKKFFSDRIGNIAMLGFMLMPANWFIVGIYCTELPFLFLAMSGICLSLSRHNCNIILSGCVLAVANWIRPLCIIFLLTIILVSWIDRRKKSIVMVLSSYIVGLCVIGTFTYTKIGHFSYQSTTGGVNLAMKANDKADGSFRPIDPSTDVYIKYIDQYTCFQRDSIWKARSIDWIKKNPVRYMNMCIKGLAYLYAIDNWPYKYNVRQDGYYELKEKGYSAKQAVLKRLSEAFLFSLCYYLFFLLAIYALCVKRREIFSLKGSLLLITVLGTLMCCLLAIGQRSHHSLIFPIILWGAYGIDLFVNKYFIKKKNGL